MQRIDNKDNTQTVRQGVLHAVFRGGAPRPACPDSAARALPFPTAAEKGSSRTHLLICANRPLWIAKR